MATRLQYSYVLKRLPDTLLRMLLGCQPSQLFADPQQLLFKGLSVPVANRVKQLSSVVHLSFFVISDGAWQKPSARLSAALHSKTFTSGYRNNTAFIPVW
jgi:hypothetical protein